LLSRVLCLFALILVLVSSVLLFAEDVDGANIGAGVLFFGGQVLVLVGLLKSPNSESALWKIAIALAVVSFLFELAVPVFQVWQIFIASMVTCVGAAVIGVAGNGSNGQPQRHH
jgi:hypothetical protein